MEILYNTILNSLISCYLLVLSASFQRALLFLVKTITSMKLSALS